MRGLNAKIHKWLALLMAVQILFWFVSGLFFAVFPIERVRSEHMIAEAPARPVPFDIAADGMLRLGSAGVTGALINATAIGNQAYDKCPTLTLDNAGNRTPAECW